MEATSAAASAQTPTTTTTSTTTNPVLTTDFHSLNNNETTAHFDRSLLQQQPRAIRPKLLKLTTDEDDSGFAKATSRQLHSGGPQQRDEQATGSRSRKKSKFKVKKNALYVLNRVRE